MNNSEKEEAIKFLTKAELNYDFSASPNSWEWVAKVREILTTDTEKYPWRDACEDLWSQVSEIQFDEQTGFKRTDTSGDTPLEALDSCIEACRYPPLEVLIAISDAFKIYLAAEGKLTLEEVFFGQEKKGVGNYAAKKAKSKVFERFELYINFDTVFKAEENFFPSPTDKSLEGYAELFLALDKDPLTAKHTRKAPNFDNIIEPESFLRSYRRWVKAGRSY